MVLTLKWMAVLWNRNTPVGFFSFSLNTPYQMLFSMKFLAKQYTIKPILRNGNENIPMDIYFISVTGGVRPIEEQTLLLKQVEKVAKKFNARFVINISELGEDDPLVQNVASNGAGDRQSQWLKETLENSESKWCIAVGFHPLVACEDDATQTELKHELQSLHGIFLKYGMDAYISGQSCTDNADKRPIAKSKTGTARYKGPLLTKVNQNLPYSANCKWISFTKSVL
ncbi:uncharacterized protein LOC107813732 isoform X1 [Nicotiana tabacum]|uniref:Uncharacterized protein LOC107813732 isoform X1 n=2 Tax=Nicotiana tabacum TaxID=4097 RepID=A0AC58TN26_TOBAC